MVEMSTVWDRTSAFVASATAAVLPIAAVLLFVPIAVEIVFMPALAAHQWAQQLLTIVLWIVELSGTLALIVLALGATLHAGEAFRAAVARLPQAIGILVLLFIVAGVTALPLGIVLAASGVDITALKTGAAAPMPAISPGLALFLVVYAIAWIVFVVWATARLIVIEPVILAERRGIGAIARAFALTRGLTWRIVGVLILYAIVATVAVLAAREVFGTLFGLIASGDGTITLATILTALVVALVSAGFKTVAAVFVGKLYQAVGEAAERRADLP